jgi:hypothetical protein
MRVPISCTASCNCRPSKPIQFSGIQYSLVFRLLKYESPATLYAYSGEQVMNVLEAFVKRLEAVDVCESQPIQTEQLMAHATAKAPGRLLAQRQTTTLSRLFHSIQSLEAGTRTVEGRRLIQQTLGAVVARDVIDFWEDEYIV